MPVLARVWELLPLDNDIPSAACTQIRTGPGRQQTNWPWQEIGDDPALRRTQEREGTPRRRTNQLVKHPQAHDPVRQTTYSVMATDRHEIGATADVVLV